MPLQNMKAIQTVTVGAGGAASIDFTSIPQTYTDLHLLVSLREESSTSAVAFIKFNNSTANRSERYIQGNGSSATSGTTSVLQFIVCQPSDTASTFGNASIYIPNYTSSNFKSVSSDSVSENNATGAFSRLVAGLWSDTSAINQITITTNTGDVAEYSTATLYGVSNTIAGGAKAYGGNVTEDENYFYHTFLASGTFRPTQSLSVDCLVVAGGGSGGADSGGGGGAGGFRTSTGMSVTATDYTITVGGGGASPVNTGSLANPGTSSTFSTITSSGGGRGGDRGYTYPTGSTGGNGGSGGGGGGAESGSRAAGTGNSGSYSPSEGNNGGAGRGPAGDFSGGGGGGAGGAGTAASATAVGGAGGIGSYTAISGGSSTGVGVLSSSNYYFAGGGGGGGNATAGAGGIGGGGTGGLNGISGNNALANTGGGGGGAGNSTSTGRGGAGGSGVVIVRYAK